MVEEKSLFMRDDEYRLIRELIETQFGFLMKGDKRLTIHTKLSHRLKLLGLPTYADYIRYIHEDGTGEELTELISHITNSETYFLREKHQLDLFAEMLPEIKSEKLKKGRKDITILSVGCASGEEPYSLNIISLESGLFLYDGGIRITGIDVNKYMIQKARDAVYTPHSFRGIDDRNFIEKHFTPENGKHVLRKAYSRNVEFVLGNVTDFETFRGFTNVDVIFCRNLLIYMSDDGLQKIIRNFSHSLAADGYLFIGSSESLIQKTDTFVPEFRGGVIVYRKNVKD